MESTDFFAQCERKVTMTFSNLLQKNGILIDLQGSNKNEILTQMAQYMVSMYALPKADLIIRKILEREAEMSTGIGCGIAIPHARVDTIDRIYLIAARSVIGVDFNAIDEQPVNLIFMMISPTTSAEHTQILSSLSRILSPENVRKDLVSAEKPEQFIHLLIEGQETDANGQKKNGPH